MAEGTPATDDAPKKTESAPPNEVLEKAAADLRAAIGSPDYHAADALVVKRRLKRGMGRFPSHVHLDFAERFEVTAGAAHAEIDGGHIRLISDPGRRTLYIPPGVPHVNPYNEEDAELEFWQSFLPGTEGVRSYVETLAEVLSDGRDDDGDLPWALALAVADETRERTYLTPLSRKAWRGNTFSFALQRRLLLPAGSTVARIRGYTVYLDGG